MKENKMQKGITLVALIITIIVLLILAVVTIREITGEGIISHAKNAIEITIESNIKEEISMAWNRCKIDYKISSGSNIEEYFTKEKLQKYIQRGDNNKIFLSRWYCQYGILNR